MDKFNMTDKFSKQKSPKYDFPKSGQKLKKWLDANPHAWLFPILMAAYLILFFSLNITSEPKYIIHCALDDIIPFIDWFVIPYALWFLAFPGSLILYLLLDKQDFYDLCFVIFGGAMITFVIYFLWPSGLDLRPETVGDSLCSRIMQLIWLADPPNNVCPSLHCSISAAIALVTLASRKMRPHPTAVCLIVFMMMLICVSTVFVKQHSVLDIVAGVALSLALWLPLVIRRACRSSRRK